MQLNSQEDIFATQEPETTKGPKYDYLVLCDHDESVQHPFALFPRKMFSTTEILDKWVDSILDPSSRLKSLNTLERVPNKTFGLFGKIEEGIF